MEPTIFPVWTPHGLAGSAGYQNAQFSLSVRAPVNWVSKPRFFAEGGGEDQGGYQNGRFSLSAALRTGWKSPGFPIGAHLRHLRNSLAAWLSCRTYRNETGPC